MGKNKDKKKLAFFIGITVIGVYLGFKYILPLFIPFLFAYFIASILYPIVNYMQNKMKIPRTAGSVIILILFFGTIGGIFCWLFQIFIEQLKELFSNLPVYQAFLTTKLESICNGCDRLLGLNTGIMQTYVEENINQLLVSVKSNILPTMTEQTFIAALTLFETIGALFLIVVVIMMLVKDMDYYKEKYKKCIFYHEFHLVTAKLSEAGLAYLKAQVIIIGCVTLFCSAGLMLLKNRYALLIGILIALIDALPIFGSGIILIPWAIIELMMQNIFAGAVLLTLYLCCQFTRQLLEPKLIGNKIGIEPIITIIAMYIGFKLFGLAGFLLGPIGFILIETIVNIQKEKINKTGCRFND